jgi:hypothetical protein
MKAFEFHAQPTADGFIQLPSDVARQVDPALGIKVIVLLPENEEQAWTRFGMEQFAKGYAASDNIYDDLRRG